MDGVQKDGLDKFGQALTEFLQSTLDHMQEKQKPTWSNEQQCVLVQKEDIAVRNILLENNRGFIREMAWEQYRSMGLDENDIGIDADDLMEKGSLGWLNAIPLFDAGRGMKCLAYAVPAIRNAMSDCIGAALHFHLSESRTKKVEDKTMDSLRGKLLR